MRSKKDDLINSGSHMSIGELTTLTSKATIGWQRLTVWMCMLFIGSGLVFIIRATLAGLVGCSSSLELQAIIAGRFRLPTPRLPTIVIRNCISCKRITWSVLNMKQPKYDHSSSKYYSIYHHSTSKWNACMHARTHTHTHTHTQRERERERERVYILSIHCIDKLGHTGFIKIN